MATMQRMLSGVARGLQWMGLMALPVAIVLQLQGATVGVMLTIALTGAAMFYLGYWIERGRQQVSAE